MSSTSGFDDIRPYNDSEINGVLKRLTSEPTFQKAVHFVFPDKPLDDIFASLHSIHSVFEFQKKFIGPTFKVLYNQSSKGVTSSGFDNVQKDETYLYISNHRDIVLDSAILNVQLVDYGFYTTRIAIGDNLLIAPWITDLVKINKNFVVNRNVPVRQMLESSKKLSSFIRHSILNDNESVWIAQREGRSKDGDDKTQASLIKMLNMSADPGKDIVDSFKELSIVPMAISYEYDPCDVMKVSRVFYKEKNIPYKKTPQDDLINMQTGITGFKGRIHLQIGTKLDKELDQLRLIGNKNDQIALVATIIDKQIYQHYKLWPNNYLAFDMLNGSDQYKDKYNSEDKETFKAYIEERQNQMGEYKAEITQLLLKFYAFPLINRITYVNTGV